MTEAKKADELNKKLGLFTHDKMFKSSDVIQSHTILTDPAILDQFKDKWVLVESQSMDDYKLATNYGYKKVITLLELCCLVPKLSACIGLDVFG